MALENRFAELLSQVAREVTLRQASDVCCGDLTLEQFQTLEAIVASGGASRASQSSTQSSTQSSIGSLSTDLRVDLSTMSRNVALLERNGYLSRARSAEDGRIVNVRLTTKGKRALHTLRCGDRDVFTDVYQRLPPGERSAVIKALDVLRACLLREGEGAACCSDGKARGAAL